MCFTKKEQKIYQNSRVLEKNKKIIKKKKKII